MHTKCASFCVHARGPRDVNKQSISHFNMVQVLCRLIGFKCAALVFSFALTRSCLYARDVPFKTSKCNLSP